jgi:hypothetical protein
VRVVELFFGGAALFFGALGFGFGLLMPGMLPMSCPSCWACAIWPGIAALKAKQITSRTSE